MLNPYRISQEGEARRIAYLRQAEKAQLIKTARASRATVYEQLAVKCANMLIALGHKLKDRYDPATLSAELHAKPSLSIGPVAAKQGGLK